MHRRFAIGSLLLCVTLALPTCLFAADLPPVPNPSGVQAPAADVPPEMAAFSGVWLGPIGKVQVGVVVQEIAADGTVRGIYAWGALPGIYDSGSEAFTGEIDGNELSLELSWGADVDLEAQTATALKATYHEAGKTYTGRLTKK